VLVNAAVGLLAAKKGVFGRDEQAGSVAWVVDEWKHLCWICALKSEYDRMVLGSVLVIF
jgi:hypothetical protein